MINIIFLYGVGVGLKSRYRDTKKLKNTFDIIFFYYDVKCFVNYFIGKKQIIKPEKTMDKKGENTLQKLNSKMIDICDINEYIDEERFKLDA